MELGPNQLLRIRERSSLHVMDFASHAFASCFYCPRSDIPAPNLKETTDCGLTYLCPHCHVDAVLPGQYPTEVLEQMGRHFFNMEGF